MSCSIKAIGYASLNDADKAFESLQRVIDLREYLLVEGLDADPIWAALRRDARWAL